MQWQFIIVMLSHAFVAWAVASLFIYFFLIKSSLLKTLLIQQVKKMNLNVLLISKLKFSDLSSLLEPIIDERLDTLIDQYRHQIPMLSLFLTISLTTKVKSLAKVEVLKALPEIQAQLMTKTDKFLNLSEIIEEYLQEFQLNAIVRHHLKREILLMKAASSLFGLGVGILVAVLIVVY